MSFPDSQEGRTQRRNVCSDPNSKRRGFRIRKCPAGSEDGSQVDTESHTPTVLLNL